MTLVVNGWVFTCECGEVGIVTGNSVSTHQKVHQDAGGSCNIVVAKRGLGSNNPVEELAS